MSKKNVAESDSETNRESLTRPNSRSVLIQQTADRPRLVGGLMDKVTGLLIWFHSEKSLWGLVFSSFIFYRLLSIS